MDFNKPSTCKKITKFLLDNLKSETEKESLTNIISGKSVLKGDAIDLLLSLIQAMTIIDQVNMEEFEAAKLEEEGKKDNEGSKDQPGTSGIQNVKAPISPVFKVPDQGAQKIKEKFDNENVSYFFATNKCKFGKECRKKHPKICNKFKKFGLAKFNKSNGCNEDCEHYHPKAIMHSA